MPEVHQLVRRLDLFPRWIPSERPSTRKLSGWSCIQAIRIDLQYNMCIYQYKGKYKPDPGNQQVPVITTQEEI